MRWSRSASASWRCHWTTRRRTWAGPPSPWPTPGFAWLPELAHSGEGLAIAYARAKAPVAGAQLLSRWGFLKRGAVALALSFAVLWLWTFSGYWRWTGF